MRSFLRPAAGLTCLIALATAGCSSGSADSSDAAAPAGSASPGATSSPSSSTSSSPSSSTSYAPYVSATAASDNDSTGSPTTYNLAFVISGGSGCTPKWNGTAAIGDTTVQSRISALKESGAAVRVSFGGASGEELAESCDSARELAEAYGKALDAAGSEQADFDIEGDALTDSTSVELRSRAIALLQQERSDLKVSFTLPVMPSGLDEDSLTLLESANNNSVQVATVNLMTMNYSESYDGDMGGYAITAAKAAHDQLADVFGLSDAAAWRGMALTSMIGVNDVDGETFTLSDAAQVRAFAEEKEVAWVSMWSTLRDQECEDGNADDDDAATNCSGVEQEAGAFAEAFAE
ncbi:chitinase [Streptomyces blattellae]|uniref:chitinase n=1 Tax=Streptomyces blattellae TaxID=2569855 RepID=UPI0012B6CE10|nr:chitinase [Streptomyces blattellae]